MALIQKKIHEINEHPILLFLFFFIISLAVFSPSYLNLDFFWDDERFIFLNPTFMQSPSWYSFWNSKSAYFKSWPLGYAFFWVLIKKFSIESFFFYKTFNILLHTLNASLVFNILKKLNFKKCFLASLVFLIHPLHVETVSWFFQALTILSCTFFLLSFIFFIKFEDKKNFLFLFLSVVAFLFSLWTKSIAILSPFMFMTLLWINKSPLKKYISLIPFFLISFYIGVINIGGTASLSNEAKSHPFNQNSIFRVIDEGARSFMSENTKNIVSDDSSKYFDYLYGAKPKSHEPFFNRELIFKQGTWHYFIKLFVPTELRFIYKNQDISYWHVSFVLICLLLAPLYYLYKEKKRMYLLISSVAVVFLAPYLGTTFITFFYWSPVSDRYTYFYVLTLALILAFVESSNIKKINFLIFPYILALSLLGFNYGHVFNTPIIMYEKIIKDKPHPAIYSLLFEQYLIKANFLRASEILTEGIKHFPNDRNLKNDLLRLKMFKKSTDYK